MKLRYTNESTFITEIVEIDDNQYQIAEHLHTQYKDVLPTTPIIVRDDKKSLVFCIDFGDEDMRNSTSEGLRSFNRTKMDRIKSEAGEYRYKVIIEKLK
jgi:hypothetical protein